MDLSLLRHQSDSRYCFALDESHVLIRLAVSKLVNLNKVQLVYGDPMTFHHKHIYLSLSIKHQDRAFNYYETILEISPIRLMYIFYLEEDDEQYYFYDFGLSKQYIFDLAFISAFQFVGENYNDYVKENPAWKGRIFYQIFPDRFCKSSRLNKDYVNCAWDNKNLRNNRGAFLGGDLYGVIEKLPYLKDLGINAIYLTPIHPSDSNHKYDIKDYYDIDERFGGKEAFMTLVEEAHNLDIKIMMDMVFNHTSAEHPFFIDVKQKGKASYYYDWYFINGDYPSTNPLNYKCFGYFGHMPKINTNNRNVQDYFIDVVRFYINYYHVDGFRLDVSEGVSHDFWNRLKINIKDLDPDVILIGENWFNAESYLGVNELDGIMNYPFLAAVSGYVTRRVSLEDTVNVLDGLLMRYKDGFNRMMMNILSSHDIERISHLTNNNYDLNLISYAMMFFYLGYPLIYYGEEIFMDGGSDPDNRRGMEWDSPNFYSHHHSLFKKLIALRKEEPLSLGDIEITHENNLLKMRRTYHKQSYTLLINMSNESYHLEGNYILSNKYQNAYLEPEGFVIKRSFE